MKFHFFIMLAVLISGCCQAQNLFSENLNEPGKDLQKSGWSFKNAGNEARQTAEGLEIDNTRSRQKRYVTYDIPHEKGKLYTAEVMIKTEDVTIRDNHQRGAAIFVGFLDENKQWVTGGTFPHGVMGSTDWRRLTVPLIMASKPNVRYMQIWLGIEGSGKAWFKDVKLSELQLDRSFVVDTTVNPPKFKFNVPPTFIDNTQNAVTLELRRKSSDDYFIFFIDNSDYVLPHGLVPGNWEATYSASSSGAIFFNIKKTFALTAKPEPGKYTAVDSFPNGVYTENPELEIKFYPAFPEKSDVKIDINGQLVRLTERNVQKIRFAPTDKLNPGSYQVKLSADGRTYDFLYNNRQPKHEITFRDDKIMMVDGKPFFPVGTYRDPSDWLFTFDGIKEAGFNMTHSYVFEEGPPDAKKAKKYLAACRENGVMSFMGISRRALRNKDFDAIATYCAELSAENAAFLWYLIDEPVWQKINPYYVREYYRAIKRITPQVPVIQLHTPIVKGDSLLKFYGQEGDIFWHDTYPVPTKPLDLVHREAVVAASEIAPSQAVWSVIQAFDPDDKKVLNKKPEEVEPKAGKIRCMTHLALAGGTRGIIFYWLPKDRYDMIKNSPVQWAEICATTKELNELMPFLTERDVPMKLDLPGQVKYWAKTDGSRTALAIINSEGKAVSASVNIPGFKKNMELKPYEVQIHIFE